MRLITPNLGNNDYESNEPNPTPEVDKNFGQTISRLMGLDRFTNIFRFLQSDYYGSLRVTRAQPLVVKGITRSYTFPQSFITLIPANDSRQSFFIQNYTVTGLALYFADSQSGLTAFTLDPGDTLYEEIYTGKVIGNASTGGTVITLELAEFRG